MPNPCRFSLSKTRPRYEARRERVALEAASEIDMLALLDAADVKIDGPLLAGLRRGDLRLLRCSWLLDHAEVALRVPVGGDKGGKTVLRMLRCQDLPDAAFFTPEEAAALLQRRDRSVLALSYGWLTAAHPEPDGTTFAAVLKYLRAEPSARACGLFWDFASCAIHACSNLMRLGAAALAAARLPPTCALHTTFSASTFAGAGCLRNHARPSRPQASAGGSS